MKSVLGRTVGVSFALLALFACGGGSGGGGSASLEGTWLGPAIDGTWWMDAPAVVVSVVIDGSNQITGLEIDGTPQNLTGTTAKVSGQSRIFEFALSDGTEGGLILDPAVEHAVMLDQFARFAILEKGAAGLPAYQQSDVFDKDYAGLIVFLDGSMELDEVHDAQVQVFADGAFSGSDSAGYTFSNTAQGKLVLVDALYGVWQGQYDANGPGGASTGWVVMLLSPDKAFVGAIVCDSTASSPLECGFGAWPEQ